MRVTRRSIRRLSVITAVVALLALVGPAAAAAAVVKRAPLHTSGSKIVDAQGRKLVLAGVNWFGFETHNHVVHGLWARDYKSMLAQIRAQGFNAIRLPFSIQAIRSGTLSGVDFGGGRNAALAGRTPLQAMDVIVKEARRNDLLVLLDLHSLADDSHGHPLWYGNGYSEADWVAAWRTMATRYGDDRNVIGADLKNEPHGEATWGDGSATDWRAAAERAGNAVLSVAPHWLIVVEGIEGPVASGQRLDRHWWGGNLEGVRRDPVRLDRSGRVVYSPHEYGPGVFRQPWFDRPDFQAVLYERWAKGFGYIAKRGIAPVLVGEFGGRQVGTGTTEGIWQRQFMDHLSKKGFSWTYWAWNPNSGDTGGVLQPDWHSIEQPKMKLLAKLIARKPVPFP